MMKAKQHLYQDELSR